MSPTHTLNLKSHAIDIEGGIVIDERAAIFVAKQIIRRIHRTLIERIGFIHIDLHIAHLDLPIVIDKDHRVRALVRMCLGAPDIIVLNFSGILTIGHIVRVIDSQSVDKDLVHRVKFKQCIFRGAAPRTVVPRGQLGSRVHDVFNLDMRRHIMR